MSGSLTPEEEAGIRVRESRWAAESRIRSEEYAKAHDLPISERKTGWRRFFSVAGRWILPSVAIAFAVGIWTVVIFLPSDAPPRPKPDDDSSWARAVRECNKQVPILLTTHDPVELERAIALVRALNCGVRSRLPRE